MSTKSFGIRSVDNDWMQLYQLFTAYSKLKDSEQRIESLVLQTTTLQHERDTIRVFSENIREELKTLQRAHSVLQSERDELNRLNNDIQEQLRSAQAQLSAAQLGNDDLTEKVRIIYFFKSCSDQDNSCSFYPTSPTRTKL